MPRVFAYREGRHDPALVTPWTLMHVASGIAVYTAARAFLPGLSFWAAFSLWFAAHLAYEAKDYYYAYVAPTQQTYKNSLLNSIGDQAAGMLGFALGASLRPTLWQAVAAVLVLFGVLVSPLMAPDGRASPLNRAWSSRG